MPSVATKSKLVIFSIKVKVKRFLTLVLFERVLLFDYACQIWSLYLLGFKSYGQGYRKNGSSIATFLHVLHCTVEEFISL